MFVKRMSRYHLATHEEMNVSTLTWANMDLRGTASNHLVDLSSIVKT